MSPTGDMSGATARCGDRRLARSAGPFALFPRDDTHARLLLSAPRDGPGCGHSEGKGLQGSAGARRQPGFCPPQAPRCCGRAAGAGNGTEQGRPGLPAICVLAFISKPSLFSVLLFSLDPFVFLETHNHLEGSSYKMQTLIFF